MTITKDMTIQQVLDLDTECAKVFFACGMFCVGCPASAGESIEEAAAVHGINGEMLVTKLNEYFADKK